MSEPLFRVSDILTRVRLIKADATYAEASVLLWVNDGVIELYTECPKARQRIDTPGIRDYSLVTEVGQAVPCSIQFLPLLVDYVLFRAFLEDSDSQDHAKRALDHFKLFLDRAHLIQYGAMAFRQTPAPPAAPAGGK